MESEKVPIKICIGLWTKKLVASFQRVRFHENEPKDRGEQFMQILEKAKAETRAEGVKKNKF